MVAESTLLSELPRFLAYLAHVRGRAPNTVRAYRSDLTQAAAVLTAPLAQLTHGTVETWLATAPSAATRQRWRAALAAYCRWAIREDLITRDPTALVQVAPPDATVPRPIAADHLRALDAAIAGAPQPYRLLLTILRETGMRAGEAVGLNVGDVVLDVGREGLRVIGTKGNVDRVVVITPDAMPRTLRALRRWQKTAGPMTAPLVVSSRGTRVTYDTLEYHWQKVCTTAGLVDAAGRARYTLHQLRHTVATALIADLPEHLVSRALGHRDPRSTRRYAAVSDDQLRAALGRRR